jgi:hypothetical protein
VRAAADALSWRLLRVTASCYKPLAIRLMPAAAALRRNSGAVTRSTRIRSMPAGVVLLGQVAARLSVLEVVCNRCDRHGQLHTSRLLAEHGPSLPMPDLRFIIAARADSVRV